MTGSSYRSTPAWSVASHEALGLWNRHAGGESTTRWTQRVRLPGVRSAQLQFDAIAREKLTRCRHTGLWYLVNEGLSVWDKVQIIETDLGSKAWANMFCQESWRHAAQKKDLKACGLKDKIWRQTAWRLKSG